jgi:glutamate-1-semialdehyde 2,1-aminomutase
MDRGTKASERLFEEAQRVMPGGVNSPVRAFGAVGGTPRFLAGGQGARVIDVDGNVYIDYVGSWGPLILGHRDAQVERAVAEALARGWTFGAPTEAEVTLARTVCEAVPSVEMVRMVNSGTEATLSALRLARGHTGRDRIVKFSGCYHGHHDALLVAAGSGLATFGAPSSPGVTAGTAADTIVCPFNDLAAVREAFAQNAGSIACVIVEPVAGNMGVVAPAPGFLEGLRKICNTGGALLVFDEVMTGFRLARGGAQERFGVRPDLTTLGKVIGGGLPVGAYGGTAQIMQSVSPAGRVYQAGTLSGNPLAMAAGVATLERLADPGAYDTLESLGSALDDALAPALARHAGAVGYARVGSMFTLFFRDGAPSDFAAAAECDTARYARYFHAALARGVYLPPSQFEACFISLAHSREDIATTAAVLSDAIDAAIAAA